MNNPWMKKNPCLSLWLSGANAAAGAARVPLAAAVRRRQAQMARRSIALWTEAWSATLSPRPSSKPRGPRS